MMPSRPSSPMRRSTSTGTWCLAFHSAAWGAISSRANSRASACTSRWVSLRVVLTSAPLEDRGVGGPAALAHRLQAVAGAGAAHAVDQRGHEPRAGGAERVPERDRAAVRVEPVRVGAQLAHPGEGHGGEGLVHLVALDVVERE